MASRVHLFITGRVQGVFYRQSTQQKADELRLKGFVRNLGDGRVEAVLEGNGEKINEMIKWCRIGPSGAKVDHIDVVADEPLENYKDFSIKY